MAKKTTGSNLIKDELRRHPDFGGRDWKRQSKKGIEGTDTNVIRRAFINSATGQAAEVLEISGHAHIQVKDGRVFVFTQTKPKAPAPERRAFTTILDSDPENNRAADQALKILIEDSIQLERIDPKNEDEFDRLLDEAGKQAWHNRLCFAYCTQYGEPMWFITPVKYFEIKGACPVGGTPDFSDVIAGDSSALFAIDENKSPQQIADELMVEGFVFLPAFQNFIDPAHNDLVPAAPGPDNPAPSNG